MYLLGRNEIILRVLQKSGGQQEASTTTNQLLVQYPWAANRTTLGQDTHGQRQPD